jgi:endonuclease/exonuclease/phosphatase family metal-dependent hydrolase
MKILTWNLNFWENWKNENRAEWRKNVQDYLSNLDFDFILLQESNPAHLMLKKPYSIFCHLLKPEDFSIEHDTEFVPWGNSIAAKNGYTLVKNHLVNNGEGTAPDYCGRSALMYYDFSLPNGKIITLMNFYGKRAPSGDYPILELGLEDIKNAVNTNTGDHLIVLAGDFNSDFERETNSKYKRFFETLEEIGLINCTEEFKSTMVPEKGERMQYPNDKIFVNKPYHELVKCTLHTDTSLKLSDHRPIECTINI